MFQKLVSLISNQPPLGDGKQEFATNRSASPNNSLHVTSSQGIQDATFAEIRGLAKTQIELFEHWSRRLIDEIFKEAYGADYLNAQDQGGHNLVKNEIRNRIQDRKANDPSRYPRDIDALLLEDIIYFFTRDDLYERHFREVMEPFYSGRNEVRKTLERLVPIRNKLSHDNHISIREAEQVLCYTNDFIDSFKAYFQQQGKGREFNVPVLISFSDSQGNRVFRNQPTYRWEVGNVKPDELDLYRKNRFLGDAISTSHRSGERYEIEFEVDGSFSPDYYTIEWKLEFGLGSRNSLSGMGRRIVVDFTDDMVSYNPKLVVMLTTNKTWHRFASQGCDDLAEISLAEVLPPIEETY